MRARFSHTKIPKQWRQAVTETVRLCQKHFGATLRSVYIRGSVAAGTAVAGVADLDTVAVVRDVKEKIDTSWVREFNERMRARYPFLTRVDIVVVPLRGIRKSKTAVLLKMQGVCVYGTDIIPRLPRYRLGKEIAIHAPTLYADIEATVRFLSTLHSPEEIKRRCVWIMKRLVRVGGELVMERSGRFSRDLRVCAILFSKYYPGKRTIMKKAVALAIVPTMEREKILAMLSMLGAWVIQEIDRVFGRRNDRA